MIHYKGFTISDNGPGQFAARRLSACGVVGMEMIACTATVEEAKAAIDALDKQPTQHIRSGGRLRADKRFRSHVRGSRAVVNCYPNLCGADTDEMVDLDKATARILIDNVSRGAPAHWTANICPRCAEILARSQK